MFEHRAIYIVPVVIGLLAIFIGEISGSISSYLKMILVLAFAPYFRMAAGAGMGFLGFFGSDVLIIIAAMIGCAVVGYFGEKNSWKVIPVLAVFAVPVIVVLLIVAGELALGTLGLILFSILAAIFLSWLVHPFIRVIKLMVHSHRL